MYYGCFAYLYSKHTYSMKLLETLHASINCQDMVLIKSHIVQINIFKKENALFILWFTLAFF